MIKKLVLVAGLVGGPAMAEVNEEYFSLMLRAETLLDCLNLNLVDKEAGNEAMTYYYRQAYGLLSANGRKIEDFVWLDDVASDLAYVDHSAVTCSRYLWEALK